MADFLAPIQPVSWVHENVVFSETWRDLAVLHQSLIEVHRGACSSSTVLMQLGSHRNAVAFD